MTGAKKGKSRHEQTCKQVRDEERAEKYISGLHLFSSMCYTQEYLLKNHSLSRLNIWWQNLLRRASASEKE